jgi:hypothetical protein
MDVPFSVMSGKMALIVSAHKKKGKTAGKIKKN